MLHASRYPGCPIGITAAHGDDRVDPVYQALTPLQRQIARAHWSGADAVALSGQFSRSRYTIERQLAAIYEAFGVGSAGTLRDAAVRRGLIMIEALTEAISVAAVAGCAGLFIRSRLGRARRRRCKRTPLQYPRGRARRALHR